MNFKIISYYTKGDNRNYYQKCADMMKESCSKFNFDCYIKEVPSKKNYNDNIKFKPIFIKQCVEQFDVPVLFLDIDAEITGSIPDEMKDLNQYDIGITKTWGDVESDQQQEYKKHMKIPSSPSELSIRDGFLYVNNTKNGIDFLTEWDSMCKTSMYQKWRSHRPLDHTMKLFLIQNKPTKIKILSSYVNCCPTISRHGGVHSRDKNELLKNNKVFCFYRVSSMSKNGEVKNAIQ